jgi:outer membrane usher protein
MHRACGALLSIALCAGMALTSPADAGEGEFRGLVPEGNDVRVASAPMTALGGADGATSEGLGPETGRLSLYALRVNGQEARDTPLLRLPDGTLLARQSDLERWRLRLPQARGLLYRGESWFPLEAFSGVTFRVDETRQSATLDLPPEYFGLTQIDADRLPPLSPSRAARGGFLNYDTFVTSTEGRARFDGQFEAGVFTSAGVGSSRFIAREAGGQTQGLRLDTTWQRDFPDERRSLLVGDAIGSPGLWGQAVRYGGLRWGTNFATTPGFVTFPQPALRGDAVMPSATDIFVDGVLRRSASVPPGPFQVSSLPVVTGQGEIRVVTRDLLGREQVSSVPYYASNRLLRPGLDETAWDVGAIRQNYGLASNDYGRGFVSVQSRRGLSDRFTAEGRAELLRDQQTIGAGASVSVPAVGIVSSSAAISHGTSASGGLYSAMIERQVSRGVSAGVRSQWASPGFVQMGLQPGRVAPARQASANLGVSPGVGSFGLAWVRQDYRDQPSIDLASVSYSIGLGQGSALILNAWRSLSGERQQAVGLVFSTSFGERDSAMISTSAQARANQSQVQLQRNLPAGSGSGYRVMAGEGDLGPQRQLGWYGQGDSLGWSIEAAQASGLSSYRAGATGALGMIEDHPFAARRLEDSVALVRVADLPGVDVLVENQPVARTDAHGLAVLPRLMAWHRNRVTIDATGLPLDVQMDAARIDAVPPGRSAVLLDFPVRHSVGALIVLQWPDGQVVPVGAEVRIAGEQTVFPVAERGEVYVTGLKGDNRLQVTWRDRACELRVEIETSPGPVRRLGPLTCQEVMR